MTAINKFAVFSYNYPPEFIKECWKDTEWLADHLAMKFRGYYEDYGARGVMLAFYTNLDGGNRQKLEKYIAKNVK